MLRQKEKNVNEYSKEKKVTFKILYFQTILVIIFIIY